MRTRWPVLAVVLACGVAYFGYPYVTLYRLDIAVRQADAATLRSMVDWYSVREGLKEDICDMVLDEPSRPSTELAPFGAGFVRGMAGNAVDRAVTPETLVSFTSGADASSVPGKVALRWAFFESPTRFSVRLWTDTATQPIRVAMELQGGRWQVRRVWLPDALLERAGGGT